MTLPVTLPQRALSPPTELREKSVSLDFLPFTVLLSRPAPLHQKAEKAVNSGLISAAGSFQPCEDIRINPDSYSLLLRPVELADDSV